MDFNVALAQIKPKLGCLADNMTLAEAAIEKGIAEGAQLIVFPELALTGYFLKDLVPDVAVRVDAPQIEKLKLLSRRISIAVGFVEVTPDYRFFNSCRTFCIHGSVESRHHWWVRAWAVAGEAGDPA